MTVNEQSVFIIEDDVAVRDSLGLLLGLNGYRIQSFARAEDFLRVYDPSWAGCLLLDIRMPGMSGLELQTQLREKQIALPVIIITAHADVPVVKQALKAGAIDFLEKPVDPDALLAAVAAALDADNLRRSASLEVATVEQRMSVLTPREREVMKLVAQGIHHREIATMLGISPRTVEVHRARVMDKLEVRNMSELVRLTMKVSG